MTSTKRKFLKAGAILGIICSIFAVIAGVGSILIREFVTEENVVNLLKTDQDMHYVENEDKSYYFAYTNEDGVEEKLTEEEIELAINVVISGTSKFGIFTIGIGIATFVLSIVLINKTNKNKSSKGATIALLVLSAIQGNMITFAFMIVALCLRDLPPATLENVDKIEEEVSQDY